MYGLAELDGRPVVVSGDDFTVRGGSNDASISAKRVAAESLSLELRLPHVRLLDGMSGGGSVKTIEQAGRTYIPELPGWHNVIDHLNVAPSVSLVLGSVAGFGAARATTAHYSVIVRGTAQMMIAGPALVEQAALGSVSKEELGHADIHSTNGAVDDAVDTEAEAFDRALDFLSYLPSSVDELPPVEACDDPVDRRDERLADIVPRNPRQSYDMRAIVTAVVDAGSFFEIGRSWGTSIIGGFARLGRHAGRGLRREPDDARRRMDGRLVPQADPADRRRLVVQAAARPPRGLPRFLIGIEAERACTVRFGSEVLVALRQAQVPYCTVVIRKAFGIAGASNRKPGTESMRMAWPSGDWGSLPLEGGLEVAYKAELAASDDPAALRDEIAERLNRLRSPHRSAEFYEIEQIIDPRDTRPMLCDWVQLGAPHAARPRRRRGASGRDVARPSRPRVADRTAEGRAALPPRRLDVRRHRSGTDRTSRRRSDAGLARRLPGGVLVRRLPVVRQAVLVRPVVAADRRRSRHRHRATWRARSPARTCAMPRSRRPRTRTSAATTVVPACRGASTAMGSTRDAARRPRPGSRSVGSIDIPRDLELPEQTVTIDFLESAVTPAGLVAIGLGGYEVGFPAAPYAPHFAVARAIGLHSVPHAGETEGRRERAPGGRDAACRAHRARCACDRGSGAGRADRRPGDHARGLPDEQRAAARRRHDRRAPVAGAACSRRAGVPQHRRSRLVRHRSRDRVDARHPSISASSRADHVAMQLDAVDAAFMGDAYAGDDRRPDRQCTRPATCCCVVDSDRRASAPGVRAAGVRVCLNTDDPGWFATRPRHRAGDRQRASRRVREPITWRCSSTPSMHRSCRDVRRAGRRSSPSSTPLRLAGNGVGERRHHARTVAGSPAITTYSWLRVCDTVPTFSPAGLWMPIWAPT